MSELELLTVAQVADLLHVTQTTVYAKVRSEELGAVRLGRGPHPALRIPRSELERFLAEGATRTAELQEVA